MVGTTRSYDFAILGGGVIGLSLAWELACQGADVCVADQGPLGREASWAGAGMVPPGPDEAFWRSATPMEKLAGLSGKLHVDWHHRLKEQTGIDNGWRRCGGVHLALDDAGARMLDDMRQRLLELGVRCQTLDRDMLLEIEPTIRPARDLTAAYSVPDESQIRNPRHLRALAEACRIAGVDLRPNFHVRDFTVRDDQVLKAVTDHHPLIAGQYCLAAGSWTGQLALRLGLELAIKPVRGQIVLLQGRPGLLRRSVSEGKRYVVPRDDGRILIGSTEEDVGFVKENTSSGVESLVRFANSLMPDLADLEIEKCWSGLRPSTHDGLPYLGKVPRIANVWLASGHYRAGLQLSPGTAVLMRTMMLGQPPLFDVGALALERSPRSESCSLA